MKKISFFLIVLFAFIVNVNAEIEVNVDSSYNVGDEITYSISASDYEEISKFTITASYDDDDLEYDSYTSSKLSITKDDSSLSFSFDGDSDLISSSLLKIIFKVKNTDSASTVIKLSYNITYKDDTEVSDSISKTISILDDSSDDTLSSITGCTLSPKFDSETYSYTCSVTDSTITLKAVASDSNSDIVIKYNKEVVENNSKIKLTDDENTFKITVNDNLTYTLVVTKKTTNEEPTSNTLKSITGCTLSPSFSSKTYGYTCEVDNETISIVATATDSNSSLKYTFNDKSITSLSSLSLSYGKNILKIEVNQKETYTLTITRKDTRSSDCYLKSIILSNGSLKFNKETTKYTVTVPYEIDNVQIDAIPSNSYSSVNTKGDGDIEVGENTVTIVVTAQNGASMTYYVTIVRQEEGENPLSTNSYLKSLKISGYKIDFDKDTTDYEILVSNLKKLKITATAEDDSSEIEITGNENIENGSRVVVTVTAEDGSYRQYIITVSYLKGYTKLIYFACATFTILLLTIIGIMFVKNKKNKKKKK